MTKNEKWFYVHIDSLNITIPEEGLFIALETLTREETNNKQIQAKGGGAYDIIPTMRTKLYNPKSPNKSYHKSRTGSNTWKFDKNFHYCMEFEFE